jgi:hypothetical protein
MWTLFALGIVAVAVLAVGVTPKPKVAIRSMTSMMTTRSWTMKSG